MGDIGFKILEVIVIVLMIVVGIIIIGMIVALIHEVYLALTSEYTQVATEATVTGGHYGSGRPTRVVPVGKTMMVLPGEDESYNINVLLDDNKELEGIDKEQSVEVSEELYAKVEKGDKLKVIVELRHKNNVINNIDVYLAD